MRWEFLPAQPPFKGACFEKRAFRKKEEGLLKKACGTFGSKVLPSSLQLTYNSKKSVKAS